ncbi:MAG: carboxypeptidase regulatory-like domain-containing protein, partial [Candidatus Cloacimonetes bacterium]|nr:carboxypeptidase regulatory-like domain-containing protein [Candidatus Cloacimonadota bacterium]MCK9243442.1 carboxypeptidase regulatory-like domain-containing protein [Candidatus Cloacimonadota bacterium]
MAPSAAGTLSGTFPKTTFIMVPLSDEPMFVVSPPEQDFGTVLVSTTAHRNFFIANAGGGALGINSISLTGDAAFTLTDLPDLPASLNTGQTLTFGLDYSPTAAGVHTAQISITDNITREVHTIAITGDGFDATIYSLPLMEDWDTVTVPDLPLGWSKIVNSTSTSAIVATYASSPNSAPNSVRFYNPSDANAELYLISPPFANDIDMSSVRIKIMAKGGTNYSLQVGTMSDPNDPTTFVLAEDLAVISNWNEYVVNLTGHTPAGQFIAFRHGLGGASRSVYVDDLIFELIAPNDLAAVAITGNTTPPVNIVSNYLVSVFNNGTAAQSNYQVKLYDANDTELSSAAGLAIAPGETVAVSLSWTPTAQGPASLYGKVILAGDANPMNDTTDLLNINVTAEDVFIVAIGDGTSTNTITGPPTPYGTYHKNFRQQFLYTADDMMAHGAVPGEIYALAFNVHDLNTCSPMPNYRIRMKTTQQTGLTTTFETGQYTQVFMQNDFMPTAGWNLHTFDAPFFWDGTSNLLVDIITDLLASAYTRNAMVYYTPTTYPSSLRYQSDSTAADTATTGSVLSNRSNTRFYLNVEEMGSLSGTVTASGSPLADVVISIDDTSYEAITSASGQYSFPYLFEGDYTLTAHKIGYEDRSIGFSIVEDQNTTVDIVMTESASVNVTGTIVGSDNPTVGLSEGVINLTGVIDYTANTNAAGQFVVSNVLSGNTYDYAISRAGYQTATGTIVVGSTDYAMGSITLNELTLPPSAITATVNAAETAVNLIWGSPGTPGNYHFFDFENDNGGWVPSSDWTDPLGDWEYTDAYDITNWNPSYTAGNVTPPGTAHSGTGMWGTKINTNYTNSGGYSYLTQTLDFSGFSETQMKFWSWENLFGDWDYAQVSINGTLVWGPSWDYTGTIWQERIIDLSAYDGMSDVVVRFEMFATTTVNYAGWYIDDVYIGPAGQDVVRTSPPSVISGEFRGLSEMQAAQLAESRASLRPVRRMANNLSQPIHNPSRLPVGYQVWRLEYGQENTPAQWISLTPTMITDTTFADPAWPGFPDGVYRWAVKTIYTNDVESNPGFSNTIRKQPNDMSALSITGNSTPTIGAASNYIVTVKNTGTSPQATNAYTVKLMSGTTELASVNGPAIGVAEEIAVTVPWVPTTQGPVAIYGKVVLPEDSDATNDETSSINVHVMPAGQFGYTVGDGSLLERVPVDMYYRNSLFQMIITNADLGNFFGFFNGIQFYNNFVSDLPNMPTKIWFETTTLNDLDGGWVAISDSSTLVFDGNVNYPSGENNIVIPFAEPFMYLNGENLLVTVHRPTDPDWHSAGDKFRAQTIGTNRARKHQSDSTTTPLDPMNPPTSGTTSGTFPMTTFLGIPGGVGHLSGNVTGIDNAPLEGVLVE